MGANPLDQTLVAPALMAAKRAGRSAALRAEWTSISRVLKANGLDPDPELVELHHRLLEQPDD